jgi:hypothetical protein
MGKPISAFQLRLPQPLYEQVRHDAEAKGVSANTFILDLIEAATPLDICPTCGGSGKVPATK